MLLAAHTPGYLLTQVPSGMWTQWLGPKRLLTLNTAGAGLLLMLVPLAARLGGARGFATALAAMALFHGPMVPCQSELKRRYNFARAPCYVMIGRAVCSIGLLCSPLSLLMSTLKATVCALHLPPHGDYDSASYAAGSPWAVSVCGRCVLSASVASLQASPPPSPRGSVSVWAGKARPTHMACSRWPSQRSGRQSLLTALLRRRN